ncbi:hypothetical protein E2C01_090559 [Portunus trituberculatus]|uniref:Uncharacterized protein n=1 Tax=Portunus trituberculatus TaxID=210409 RepID=A0A5B7JGW6_PORTR|nr:hypothetical protein [Portunus trituberculatus]
MKERGKDGRKHKRKEEKNKDECYQCMGIAWKKKMKERRKNGILAWKREEDEGKKEEWKKA